MFHGILRILDGGLASTLQDFGYEVNGHPLWSARFLHSNPEAIVRVHSAFLEAGADILITASYQASIEGFNACLGLSRAESIRLFETSVELAKKAKTAFTRDCDRKVLIAGSVGPYGACKADGSEYSGSYMSSMTGEQLIDWHRPRVEALIRSGVDLLAFETIPALDEALALLKLLRCYPAARAWVTFSCKDNKCTNYGDDFSTAVKACYSENSNQLVGIGVNCTHPCFITPLLQKAEQAVPPSMLPRIVYPNSSESWTADKRWVGDASGFVDIVKSEAKTWIALGARVLGGCCRVAPSHIEEISRIIKEEKVKF